MNTGPFEELNQADRECAIDCVAAVTVLAARIPSVGKPLFDWLATEFASTHGIPKSLVNQALRQIGQQLFKSDWGFSVTKKDDKLITLFLPTEQKDAIMKN
jgi:hypothetical protein